MFGKTPAIREAARLKVAEHESVQFQCLLDDDEPMPDKPGGEEEDQNNVSVQDNPVQSTDVPVFNTTQDYVDVIHNG